jgi:hypothetical protein
LPEAFLAILFGYAFQRRKVDIKFLIAGIILAIIAYIINFIFPIRKEFCSILIFAISALILITYNKIELLKAVFSTLSLFIIFIISEFVSVLILLYILKMDQNFLKEILDTYSITTWLYGLPNLIFKFLSVTGFYIYRVWDGKKNVV